MPRSRPRLGAASARTRRRRCTSSVRECAASGGSRRRRCWSPYIDRFFSEVRDVFAERDKEFATRFFGALYPGHIVTDDLVQRSEALLNSLGADDVLLGRPLREALDELKRARACRGFAQAGG